VRIRTALAVVAVTATLAVGAVRHLAPGALAVELHKVDSSASFLARPDQPFFVLVLGSDERAGLDGARSDAIHVIGVNPALGQATIINIPRDTYVPIPGVGMSRINEAYNHGGAQKAAETVGAFVGVPIQFVAVTTFTGLQAMVDELGGVDVDVPYPMLETNSGANFPQGRWHMSGGEALAFSRNRHIPGGDFGRTQNQALLILSVLTKLRAEGTGAPDTARYLSILLRHTEVDGIGGQELYRLGRLALSLDPANVKTVTMPGGTGRVGPASVVLVNVAAASELFADFRDDAVLQRH
jgi:LCP family protein required for cell wall assembly